MKLSRQNTSFSGEFQLGAPELGGLVCYPRFSEQEYAQRIKEMESLDIGSIIIGDGKSVVNGVSICGKGCVGLVFRARTSHDMVALKIRRIDADRESMENEAGLHKIANEHGVGPRYLGHTKNLISMEFVAGKTIIEWISTATSDQFRKIARSVLEQCYILDRVGLDHGELSRLGRHVIVSENDIPYVIDFESASSLRRTINVSAATQSMFLFGAVAALAKRIVPEANKEKTIAGIRKYKQLRSRDSFDNLMEILAL
jgi:putative serine/threonine protein kinase